MSSHCRLRSEVRQTRDRRSETNTVDKQGEGVMKNRVGLVVASLLLGVLTLGSTALAQRTERIVKANIPFDFVRGKRDLSCRTLFGGDHHFWTAGTARLRRPRPGQRVDPFRPGIGRPGRPKLRFDSQGGQHVLTQVWQQGDETGQQVLRSKSPSLAVRKRSGNVQTAEAGNPR